MISLQKLFGKDDQFFTLLEASAEQAAHSIQALSRALAKPREQISLADFHATKEADKKITAQINEALVNTFVSMLEREDIEVLSAALYKVPKTVEKFAERLIISVRVVQDTDFSRHIALLDAATKQVVEMVKKLRHLGSGPIEEVKAMNGKLSQIEADADTLILEILKDLYSGNHEPTRVLAMKDLYELLEKVVDRCRDVGNVVSHIVLKNA